MARNGMDVVVNAGDRYIIFKPRGVVTMPEVLDITTQTYAGLEKPWLYNRIYDLRAFINIVSLDDLKLLIGQWDKIVGRRHAPMRFAMVTDDPVRIARAKAYGPLFPHVDQGVFSSLEEALAWLKSKPVPHDSTQPAGTPLPARAPRRHA
ncbi:MAG: hypothetical protein WDN06_10705 [Asticcacaulis sp.]